MATQTEPEKVIEKEVKKPKDNLEISS